MKGKELIEKYFSKHVETREKHWDEALQTHYYKANQQKVFDQMIAILQKKQGFQIRSESKERGEISVDIRNGKKAFLVITIITVKPFRTAVDFSLTSESGWTFGFGWKVMEELYGELNSQMEYVGSGLGDNL